MIAYDLYQRLITNLETATLRGGKHSSHMDTSLSALGQFLSSRSTEFEILKNQKDISIFLSLCKSNRQNLVLVFNYFLANRPMMPTSNATASEFLKTLLDDFDQAIKSLKKPRAKTKLQLQQLVATTALNAEMITKGKKLPAMTYFSID